MAAGLLPSPHVPVHPSGDEASFEERTEQKMVDAEACKAAVGVAEVVPEGINVLFRVQLPKGGCLPLPEKRLESPAVLCPERRVLQLPLRPVSILLGRDNNDVSCLHHR